MKTHQNLITSLLVFLLLAADGSALADDPFLEPQVLPPTLEQLTLNDSKTGEDFIIRLDENHLPLQEDFHGEQDNIPFVIEGAFSSHRDMAAHRKGGLARALVSEPYSAEEVIGEAIIDLVDD